MQKIVAYYRVSTKQQGRSGLGLEGQESSVAEFARKESAEIITAYVEIESGRRKDRPELLKAIAHAKRSKARLVVAKLDRLARNVAFLSKLMESGVDFIAVDNPHATKFTVHILAAVAEHEAEQISQRTKTALAAAKRRGVKLGSAREGHWDGREDRRSEGLVKARVAAGEAHHRAYHDSYHDLFAGVAAKREAGQTLQQIADDLNAQGHTTRGGKPFGPVQITRILKRAS